MDAFFASIEQRDNPELRGKPIAVGGSKRRGVVAAASYEARKYGVRSAMPSFIAHQKCPSIIFVKPRFGVYKENSDKIMEIFRSITDLVEPMSLDEAYLDVTEISKEEKISAYSIAKKIKSRIRNELNLTASAGISINKFLAKVASDYNKPDGLFVIQPQDVDNFIDNLEIKKIPGIGKKTQEKMKSLGINLGRDIKRRDRQFLEKKFGKMGSYFFDLLNLKINSPVVTSRIRKSIGTERTFFEDIIDHEIMLVRLKEISQKLSEQMIKKEISGRTITLKIKFNDFQVITRSRSFDHYIDDNKSILKIVSELLVFPIPPSKPIRLLGVSISNLNIIEGQIRGNQMQLNF